MIGDLARERFKVVANHAVEDRALGGARPIRAGVDGCRIAEMLAARRSDRNAARVRWTARCAATEVRNTAVRAESVADQPAHRLLPPFI